MSRRVLPLGLAAVMIAASPAAAFIRIYGDLNTFLSQAPRPPTLDDFEGDEWSDLGNPNPNTAMDVIWSSPEVLFGSDTTYFSPRRSLTPLDAGQIPDQLNARLPPGTASVGSWVTTFGQTHRTLIEAFDADNFRIALVILNAPPLNQWAFWGLISTDVSIDRIVIRADATGTFDDFAIDDFYFGAIPEPATAGLLLAVLGLSTRCRARR